MRALIDGDILLYRACNAVQSRLYIAYDSSGTPVSCSSRKRDLPDVVSEGGHVSFKITIEEDAFDEATMLYNVMLKNVLKAVQGKPTKHYQVYLTGGSNYRRAIYPEYKAGRPPKPILYKAMLAYVLSLKNHELIEGQEADDALGINQTPDSIICSIDKDLLMVEGRHYNFVKDEFITITKEEGMRNFYKQLLTGDRVDNIPGLHGIGPKKAEKILSECTTEEEMYEAVFEAYEGCAQTIERNAQLLWIRREEGELWTAPQL